ncbi:MAG TPA: integrase arm-type DNA-binding domain-containing protein [Xanthobacteraceae bacterium]|nr:integrase arm-type DNA-binding domain-containing protein [Xanthobacteraceae bacterium]
MNAKLTAGMVLRAAPAPGKDRLYVWDTELRGFGLMVTAAGRKSYVVQYRAGGRSRRMTLSGVLRIEDARKEARAILGSVAKGGDPVATKRAAQENTFREIGERYLASRAARGLRSIAQRRSILERLIYPRLGTRPIEAIKRSEVAALLEQIGDQRGPRMAGYAASVLQIVFHWFERQSDDFRSPVIRGMAPSGIVARDRILTDAELWAFWRAAASWQHPFARMMQFVLLTATRHGEAAGLMRSEIAGDVWTIPAERYKTKISHAVPLSRAARQVIAGCPVIGNAGYAFTLNGRSPASHPRSKRHLDSLMRAELASLDSTARFERWTVHDLRRTARTLMSRAGVSGDVAERCLGHVIGGVRGIYDRHHFEEEKRAAFEALAAQIERIVNPQPNVVALDRARSPT